MADISEMPYAAWLEQTVQELFDICPVCIAMQMIDANGQAFTCYWNVNQNDRAVMLDSMREDGILDFLRNNRGMVNAILNGEEEDTEEESEGGEQ